MPTSHVFSLYELTLYQDKRFEIQQKTTFEEFLALMQNDRRTANIDRDALSLIFERVSYTLILLFPPSNYNLALRESITAQRR
jgi:hypothetical protein